MNWKEVAARWLNAENLDQTLKAQLHKIKDDEKALKNYFIKILNLEPGACGGNRTGNQSDEYIHGAKSFRRIGPLFIKSEQ